MALLQPIRSLVPVFGRLISAPFLGSQSARHISLTPVRAIKEIRETKVGDVTVIEGVPVDDFRDHNLLQEAKKEGCCVLCALNLDLKYTDVLILSQFMRPGRGTLLPSRITGICRKQQQNLDLLVHQAGKAGLFKKVFAKSKSSPNIMPKRPGYNLPRYY